MTGFLSLTFEKLYLALMFLRLLSGIKRAEVFTFFGLGVNFLRIQTILARFQFPYHFISSSCSVLDFFILAGKLRTFGV